ncbi:hypothetical protein POM88_024990 [Heracleum sosnowskyi]|uniref:Ribosome-inactivating protein n=1 Tax=Heracleum sosnowskyi TaxID=360622 RepID=A0AAD8I3G6_9APIA|nr:hypothetical protein POM88_024990 [Heracleum sosnowskyi]
MSITLLRFFVFAFAAAWLASSICVNALRPKYFCVVPFYVRGASETTYDADRYVLVTLYNSAGASISVAIDKVNVNLVGFRVGYDSYFFPSHYGPETSNLFTGTKRYLIHFNETYSDMEKAAGTTRKSIKLGMRELDKAIQALYDKQFSASASSLLIIIQMIPEAVRYRYVEKLVLQYISDVESDVFLPTAAMISYEDNWISLCNRITNSIGGLIYPPFMLPVGSNQKVPITSVFLTLRLNIGVILFFCHPATSVPPFASTCQNIPEYTVMIRGRNKYCVDVELNNFKDGDKIILYPCKSLQNETYAANQLWTIKKDGTIQSGRKCLYASGLTAGQNVTIHNCATAPVPDAIKWKINDNGNIENLKYGLVLSAFRGSMYSKLTLETNTYASSQGWRLGNNTKPVVTSITGYQKKCWQTSSPNTLQMAQCSNTKQQKYELYPDGTVRPSTNTANCITSKPSQDGKTLCSGGNGERWLFNYDGSISDAANKNVLQVNNNLKVGLVVRSVDSPTDQQTWPEVMSITLSRFFVFAFSAAWLASSICVYGLRSKYYCVVPFYVRGASQATYGDFIQNLRHEMGSQATNSIGGLIYPPFMLPDWPQ